MEAAKSSSSPRRTNKMTEIKMNWSRSLETNISKWRRIRDILRRQNDLYTSLSSIPKQIMNWSSKNHWVMWTISLIVIQSTNRFIWRNHVKGSSFGLGNSWNILSKNIKMHLLWPFPQFMHRSQDTYHKILREAGNSIVLLGRNLESTSLRQSETTRCLSMKDGDWLSTLSNSFTYGSTLRIFTS